MPAWRYLMILLAATTGAVQARPLDLLVGAYTQPGAAGVHVLRFDPHDGRLQPIPIQQSVLGNPSWLVPGRETGTYYAINENGPGNPDPVGRVTRLTLDQNRHIQQHEQVSSLSDHPTHGTLSHDGRYLFVANYAVAADPGGLLTVLPLDARGHLQPATQVASYQASGVDRERQASSHVHGVAVTPDGSQLLVADLGGDRVYVYDYDPVAQPERPLRPAPRPFLQLPPGSGPRHLVFSADGRHAWLTLEMSGQVAVLQRGPSGYELQGLHDLFSADTPARNGAGAIHLSPDGRFLYAVNRGDDNQLVTFSIDARSGQLQRLQRRSTEGASTREFTFSPDGRFVLLAVQGADRIAVISRDVRTGLLGNTVQTVALASPSWLGFLPPQ